MAPNVCLSYELSYSDREIMKTVFLQIQDALKPLGVDFRPMDTSLLHVTIHFFAREKGGINGENYKPTDFLTPEFEKMVQAKYNSTLTINRIDIFPPQKKNRLALLLNKSKALEKDFNQINQDLKNIGFNTHPYSELLPHITLGKIVATTHKIKDMEKKIFTALNKVKLPTSFTFTNLQLTGVKKY